MTYLIVGRTGAGKDYLSEQMQRRGLTAVISYATRPKRTPDENTHIFITPQEAEKYKDRIAETKIGEFVYFATRRQVEESDIYIIDPKGLDELVRNMPKEEFVVIHVKTDDGRREAHAINRARDRKKEQQVYAKRNEAENAQFTDFEQKMETGYYERLSNVRCVEFVNRYQPQDVKRFLDKLMQDYARSTHASIGTEEALQRAEEAKKETEQIKTAEPKSTQETKEAAAAGGKVSLKDRIAAKKQAARSSADDSIPMGRGQNKGFSD